MKQGNARPAILTLKIIAIISSTIIGSASALADEEDVRFEADKLIHNKQAGYVEAIGNAQFSWRDYLLSADRARFYENTNIVEAWGHSVFIAPGNTIYFAQKIRLAEDWKQGELSNLAIIFEDESRLTARSAKRNISPDFGLRNEMRQALYSPCKVCQDKPAYPLWQIKAGRIVHHEETKTLYYNNIFLEIFGVPVFYLPFFTHPDPTVKRKTGLLIPSIRNSSIRGFEFKLPFYMNISPQISTKITPTITTKQGAVLQADWDHILSTGAYHIKTSAAQAYGKNRQERPGGDEFGGHLFSDGKFSLGTNARWQYGVQLVSDDEYLQFFDISNTDTLTSNLSAEWKNDTHLISATNYVFRTLRGRDREPTTLVLPFIEYEVRPPQEIFGGHFGFATSLLSILRDHRQPDVTRFSLNADWQDELIGPFGSVFNFYGYARYDIYSRRCNSSPDDLPDEVCEERDQTLTRILPLAMLDWRWPFFHQSWLAYQIFEPAVQLIYAPYRSARKIFPNEDSQLFELSAGNIFSAQRFSGIDRWEAGPRMNVQLQWTAYLNDSYSLSLLLGQVFRLKDSRDFDEQENQFGGLSNKSSDIVSQLALSTTKYGTLTQRARFDRKKFSLRLYDADFDFALGPVGVFVGYAQRNTGSEEDDRKEIHAGAALRFGQHWRAYGDIRRNLATKRSITNRFGLIYRDECFGLDLSFQQRFTTNGSVKPDLIVGLRLSFKNLGDVGISSGSSVSSDTNF